MITPAQRAAEVQHMYTQRHLQGIGTIRSLMMWGSIVCAIIGFIVHG